SPAKAGVTINRASDTVNDFKLDYGFDISYYEIKANDLKNGRVYQLFLTNMDDADLYMGRYYDTCLDDTASPTAGVVGFSKLTPD
ncbi:MAG: hypothetical protein K6E84_04090, partial [Lachnospiraceae bacterium]|nr:hypothetical protein [Lachnospiraceae bacterium]